MRKRPYLAFAILGATVISALFALWSHEPGVSKSAQIVRVGTLLPLNSDLMAVATRMRNAMDLARDDLEQKFGHDLDLTIDYQNGCFENETAAAVQKFVHDGVSIIGGSFCLFGHIPILPITEAHRIITFNTAANPDVVLNKRYAFSTNVEIKDEAAAMADFAFDHLSGRRAVTMHLDTPFGHDYHKYFKRRFEDRGGEVLFNVPNPPDGKDFGTAVARIQAAQPDVIVTFHFGVPLGSFFRDLRHAGIDAPILGNYETEDPDVLAAAGPASEGIYVATSETRPKTNAMARFESRYLRKYGVEPDQIASNSYDAIILGVQCAVNCQGDRDCMRERMSETSNYQGASGVIDIKPSGATAKPTTFKVIKSRTFIEVGEVAH